MLDKIILSRAHCCTSECDLPDLETYSYSGHEEPIQMPKPDERKARNAARKSGLVKATQQSAFAAQNLEDMLMYDVDNEDCGECGRKMVGKDHYR